MRHGFLCFGEIALSPLALWGQRTTAEISGSVADPSSAAVSGHWSTVGITAVYLTSYVRNKSAPSPVGG